MKLLETMQAHKPLVVSVPDGLAAYHAKIIHFASHLVVESAWCASCHHAASSTVASAL
jgi:hypothetical protein